jgi:hypothetical protein
LGEKLHFEVELAVNAGPRFLSFSFIEGGATNQRGIDSGPGAATGLEIER